jgi:hypothetical protein
MRCQLVNNTQSPCKHVIKIIAHFFFLSGLFLSQTVAWYWQSSCLSFSRVGISRLPQPDSHLGHVWKHHWMRFPSWRPSPFLKLNLLPASPRQEWLPFHSIISKLAYTWVSFSGHVYVMYTSTSSTISVMNLHL